MRLSQVDKKRLGEVLTSVNGLTWQLGDFECRPYRVMQTDTLYENLDNLQESKVDNVIYDRQYQMTKTMLHKFTMYRYLCHVLNAKPKSYKQAGNGVSFYDKCFDR